MYVKIRKSSFVKQFCLILLAQKEKEVFTLKFTNKILILQSIKMN